MTPTMERIADLLTHAQDRELRLLHADPDARVGGSTNTTMKALKKRELVRIEWPYYSADPKWHVTDTGARYCEMKPRPRTK